MNKLFIVSFALLVSMATLAKDVQHSNLANTEQLNSEQTTPTQANNAILKKGAHQEPSFECPLSLWSEAQRNDFVAQGFVAEGINPEELSMKLIGCLAHPNPTIRDEVTYMAYTTWLRGNYLANDTILALFTKLSADLQVRKNDPKKLYLPFAALVFSEVLRVDRVSPYLSDEQLKQAVAVVAKLINTAQDYRGFDPIVGWRHIIAHSADAALQLVLNKRLSKKRHNQLLASLLGKVSPTDHSYVFGESKRLLMPILYSWMAEKHDIEEWQKNLTLIASPQGLGDWQQAYKSQEGLHKLHNTRLFLLELNQIVQANDVERLNVLTESVTDALKQLP